MPDFETIFVGVSDSHADTKTYVRRSSDGFTVPHDSPLAPSIIGAQVDNTALKSLGDALVKAGSIDQASLDGALSTKAALLSPDGGQQLGGTPSVASADAPLPGPENPSSAPKSVS